MKKTVLTFLALSAAWVCAMAQDPTTNWPYLYPEFRTGAVMLEDGSSRPCQLNVHLRRARLHYLDEAGVIKEAAMQNMYGAQVADDIFLLVNGEMMRVVSSNEHGCVAEEVLADFSSLTETGGAYGTSSATSATRRLSSIETDSQINQNHMILLQSRSDGQLLPLLKTYYLVYPGNAVKASRSEVEKAIPGNRKFEWKEWRKKNNVKWNQPQSLQTLLDFLNP